MQRFMRPSGSGQWEVHVDGFIVGKVWQAVMGGYFAHDAEGNRLGFADTAREAAVIVADADAEEQEYRQREAEAELYAEFGMSYVCGGGRPEDVAAAWSMHRAEF